MWRFAFFILACGFLVAVAFPKENQEFRAAPLDKLDWEINKLRSQWYWFEAERKAANSFGDRNIYKEMQAEIELQLRTDASICPKRSRKGTSWIVCK